VVVPRLCENYVSPRGPGKTVGGKQNGCFLFLGAKNYKGFLFPTKKKGKNENNLEE
jgi:hypothetical protein